MTPNFKAFLTIVVVLLLLASLPAAFARDLERAVGQSGKASITLTDSREGCEAHATALRARYEGPLHDGRIGTVLGCYVRAGGAVFLGFEDGDQYALPEALFKPVAGI